MDRSSFDDHNNDIMGSEFDSPNVLKYFSPIDPISINLMICYVYIVELRSEFGFQVATVTTV